MFTTVCARYKRISGHGWYTSQQTAVVSMFAGRQHFCGYMDSSCCTSVSVVNVDTSGCYDQAESVGEKWNL